MYSSASLQSRGRIALVSSAGRRRSGSGSGFGASLTASAEFPSPPTAGAARSVDDEGRGYFSESEVQSRRSRAAAGAATARKAGERQICAFLVVGSCNRSFLCCVFPTAGCALMHYSEDLHFVRGTVHGNAGARAIRLLAHKVHADYDAFHD